MAAKTRGVINLRFNQDQGIHLLICSTLGLYDKGSKLFATQYQKLNTCIFKMIAFVFSR